MLARRKNRRRRSGPARYSAAATAFVVSCGFASQAGATQLTMYGRLDNGIEYIHGMRDANGGSANRWKGESGDWGTSMFGLEGNEDLGGGNTAIFKLEQGLNTMNGTVGGNGGFNRWAMVGLGNPHYGTISAGRMLWLSNGVWDFDPFVQESWSSASLVRGRNWPQASNNVRYQSPTMGGVDVELRVATGNQSRFNTGAAGEYGRSTGAQITYTNPYFQVRGIYDELRDSTGRFSDLFNASREVMGGVNVFLGSLKLQAAYTHMWASNASAPGAPTAADHTWLGATYVFTPAFSMTAGGYHINANGNAASGGGGATMIELGGTYALSKSTFVYLTAAQVRNSRGAAYALAPAPANAADNALAGQAQTGFYAGINHAF